MCYIWEHRGKTRSERMETVERGDRSHLWCILRSRLRPREKQETRCTSSWSVSRLLSREVVVYLCGHEHAETITYRKTVGLLDWVILRVSTQYTDLHFVFHPCACVHIYIQTSIWALFIVKMHRINRAITASPHGDNLCNQLTGVKCFRKGAGRALQTCRKKWLARNQGSLRE